jgi:hypothetical protein
MKHIFLVLLTVVQFAAFSQKVNGTFQVDLSGYYTKAQVDSAIKANGGVVKPPVVVPPVALKDCPRGPLITKVISNTNASVEIQFDAFKVDRIEYDIIRDGGSLVVRDTTPDLKTNIVALKFPAQSDGTFNLLIRGRSCISKSDSKAQFTIKSNTGGGGPIGQPPVNTDNPSVFPLLTVTEGFKEHLDLVIRDSADVRVVNDIAPDERSDKGRYLYRYLINGSQIDSDGRLKNHIVAGNNPLRVLVGKLNRQYTSEGFNKWGTGRPDEYDNGKGWYKLDAAESFSSNTSYAFKTYVAKGAQSATGFLNHVPQSYDPSTQNVQWADIAADMKLPDGHFWVAEWRNFGVDKVFNKGVTHLPHSSLPCNDADGNREVIALKHAGKTYNNVPRIENVFNLSFNGSNEHWPNSTSKGWWPTADGLDRETTIQKAQQADASDALWIGEPSENIAWQPNTSPMFGWFYPELRKRYEQNFGARGIPWEICHNYFWLGGEYLGKEGKNADYYKGLFRLSPDQLPKTEFSPGGTLSGTTLIVDGVYLNAPDMVLDHSIKLVFRLEYFKQMGYHAGAFLVGTHETRPNNRYKINYEDGTYYNENRIPLDPNVHIASGFLAQVHGNVYVEWYAETKVVTGKNWDGNWLKGDWYPNGSSIPQNYRFPYIRKEGQDIYGTYTGSPEFSYFGQSLYSKTFAQTVGGETKCLRHRIDGSAWVSAQAFKIDGVIDAWNEKRGYVYSQTKSGKTAWYYLNSYADNKWHVLEVELPNGQIVSHKVAGNGIHAKIQ